MPRNRVRILPYKMGSASATRLARSLRVLKVYRDPNRSRFRARAEDTIINWGATSLPSHLNNARVLNKPRRVRLACEKMMSLVVLHNTSVNTVPYTLSKDIAQSWLDDGSIVIARRLTSSHSGRGIHVVEPGESLPSAPLYTKYIKKRHEYRVHVFPSLGESFIQQKRRTYDVPDEQVDWRIRNYGNGFIFACNDISHMPDDLLSTATSAVSNLGLDYGSVDILWNCYENRSYVIEVNSACGLDGDTTLEFYTNNIRRLLTQ